MSKYCLASTYRIFAAESKLPWEGGFGTFDECCCEFSFVDEVRDDISSDGSSGAKPESAHSFSPFSLLLIYSIEYSSAS